jgi:spectinomycin phosphotransferase
MLERPDVEDTALVACLEQAFGLRVADIAFLPIGADPNAAAFRVVAEGGTVYFFKLRSGASNEVAVSLPRWLQEQGISQVIAPLLPTNNGRLWDSVDGYTVILYPYVEGRNGYEVPLSDQHWRELGAALRRLHAVAPPPALLRSIRRESYSPLWCERVRMMLDLVVANTWPEPVTARLATFLNSQRSQTLDLVERTERLARVLRSDSPEFVLCRGQRLD